MASVTKELLEQLEQDITSYSDIINGSSTINGTGLVTTRLGETVKTLAKALADIGATEVGSAFQVTIESGEDVTSFTDPGTYTVNSGALGLEESINTGGYMSVLPFSGTFILQTFWTIDTDFKPWTRMIRTSPSYTGEWINAYDAMVDLISMVEAKFNTYFISFTEQPIMDISNGVIKYSSGFHRARVGGSVTFFNPSTYYEVPISGSVSGAVMHYYDTSLNAEEVTPIVALSSANVITDDPSLIPLGFYYQDRYTPILAGEALDIRKAGVNYPVLALPRPIVVDMEDTLGNGSASIYLPRTLTISKLGSSIEVLTASNALVNKLDGNYCSIPLTLTTNGLADSGTLQNVYFDLDDLTYKVVSGTSTSGIPSTSGTTKFVPVLNHYGYKDTFRSASGFQIKYLETNRDTLKDLYKSLNSKFDSTHLTCIGDSILWGLTATGVSTSEPRDHELADPRDAFTSSSFANKLRKWMGYMSCGLQNENTDTPGESDYSKETLVSVYDSDSFKLVDENYKTSAKLDAGVLDGAILKRALHIGVNKRVFFNFVGKDFDIIYTTLNTDTWEVYVDNVLKYTHVATSEVSQGNVLQIDDLTFGNHFVEIRNTDSTGCRMEAVRFYKTFRFTNNGIIGTDTKEWLPGGTLLDTGVPLSTTHLFIAMGHNDRTQDEETLLPEAPARVSINIKLIIDWLRTNRPDAKICIMSGPMSTGTYDMYGSPLTYNAATDDISRELENLAREEEIAFINNYSATNVAFINGETFLADPPHPNDLGHQIIFENIVNKIEN